MSALECECPLSEVLCAHLTHSPSSRVSLLLCSGCKCCYYSCFGCCLFCYNCCCCGKRLCGLDYYIISSLQRSTPPVASNNSWNNFVFCYFVVAYIFKICFLCVFFDFVFLCCLMASLLRQVVNVRRFVSSSLMT